MRKRRIALIDPIEQVAYSRSARRGSRGYQEDAELQAVLSDKGLERARVFARARYQGVVVAVMPN